MNSHTCTQLQVFNLLTALTRAVVLYALELMQARQRRQSATRRARPTKNWVEVGEAVGAVIAVGRCINVLLHQALQFGTLINCVEAVVGLERCFVRAHVQIYICSCSHTRTRFRYFGRTRHVERIQCKRTTHQCVGNYFTCASAVAVAVDVFTAAVGWIRDVVATEAWNTITVALGASCTVVVLSLSLPPALSAVLYSCYCCCFPCWCRWLSCCGCASSLWRNLYVACACEDLEAKSIKTLL